MDLEELRFIPAPAGNGPGGPCKPWLMTVHPRACGERLPVSKQVKPGSGSSPRLRGTEQHPGYRLRRYRFIPAPAGNGP